MPAKKINMVMKYLYKSKKKKGLSDVIATLMLILLTLALVAILWAVISNLVGNKLDESQSCIDIFEKVTLNEQYTCYNQSSQELQFSISIADIDVDKVIVAISSEGDTKSLEFTNTNTSIEFLYPYKRLIGTPVQLPGKNSGTTYVYDLIGAGLSNPDKIELAPVINGKQCEASDSLLEIYSC